MNKTYVLSGPPIPLKRGRHDRRTGHVYNSQKKIMDAHRLELQTQNPTQLPNVPLRMDVVFYMPLPKQKKIREQYKAQYYHTNPKDLDNLTKMLLDVIQPILISDDKLIACINAQKIYDENPRTEFEIYPIKIPQNNQS